MNNYEKAETDVGQKHTTTETSYRKMILCCYLLHSETETTCLPFSWRFFLLLVVVKSSFWFNQENEKERREKKIYCLSTSPQGTYIDNVNIYLLCQLLLLGRMILFVFCLLLFCIWEEKNMLKKRNMHPQYNCRGIKVSKAGLCLCMHFFLLFFNPFLKTFWIFFCCLSPSLTHISMILFFTEY